MGHAHETVKFKPATTLREDGKRAPKSKLHEGAMRQASERCPTTQDAFA